MIMMNVKFCNVAAIAKPMGFGNQNGLAFFGSILSEAYGKKGIVRDLVVDWESVAASCLQHFF